jgi:hypothetical protein
MSNPAIKENLREGLAMFYSPSFTNKALPALVTENTIVVGVQPPPLLANLFSAK